MTYQFEKNGTVKPMSAAELTAADANSSVIELNCGTMENGMPYWAYIAVKPSKYKEFKRLTAARQPLRLTDYGTILKHGFDKRVPDSIKEEMKQKYGCVDNFLDILKQDVKKAQLKFLKEQEDTRIGDIVSMLKKKN